METNIGTVTRQYSCPACGNVGTVGPRCPVCGVTQRVMPTAPGVVVVEREVVSRRSSALNPHDTWLLLALAGPIVVAVVQSHAERWPSGLAFAPLLAFGLALPLALLARVAGRAVGPLWERLGFSLRVRGAVPVERATAGVVTVRGHVEVLQPVFSTHKRPCAAYVSRSPRLMTESLPTTFFSRLFTNRWVDVQGPHPDRYEERSSCGVFALRDASGARALIDARNVRLFAPIAGADGEVRIADGDEVVVRGAGCWVDEPTGNPATGSTRVFFIGDKREVAVAPADYRWRGA